MKISLTAYRMLLYKVPSPPPETGGILGCKNGVVVKLYFDKGYNPEKFSSVYRPDISKLNHVIQIWNKHDFEFCGLFHSHYPKDDNLSKYDKFYISKIMSVLPNFEHLYFPIILPKKSIFVYIASNNGKEVNIVRDKIEIIQMEDEST